MKRLSLNFLAYAFASMMFLLVFGDIEAQTSSSTSLHTKKALKKTTKTGDTQVLIKPDFIRSKQTTNKQQNLVKKELSFKHLRFLPAKAKQQERALKKMDKDLQINYSTRNHTPVFISGKNLQSIDSYKSDVPAKIGAAYEFYGDL